MPDKNINPRNFGFISNLVIQIKLVIRLMKDNRISPFLKILPFGGILYFVMPDLLIGPIDDAALLLGGSYLFLELCPPQIVAEHLQQLQFERSQVNDTKPANDAVIDAEFRDIDNEK